MVWTWRKVGTRWYILKTTRGLKKKIKKKTFNQVLGKKIFLIFPNFTVEIIYINKVYILMLFF